MAFVIIVLLVLDFDPQGAENGNGSEVTGTSGDLLNQCYAHFPKGR